MSSFRNAYVTDAGAELLAKMIEGEQLEFVKMVIGNGIYEEEEKNRENIEKRTELKSQKQEFGFSSISTSGEGKLTLKALIDNKGVEEGYRITEIGIIAKIKGDTTTEGELYSIAIAEEADYLPAESTPITYIQEYSTQISNAENVTIKIEEGVYALAEDLLKLSRPVYEESEELSELESGEEVETKWGKVAKAIKTVIDHIAARASITVLGHVMLSDSTEVTEKEGLALPATEKNPSIEGTLANQIDSLNTNVSSHLANKSNPHGVTASQVGADEEGSAQASYENAVAYTDKVVADLINGAPSTLDTLKEIADAMEENETVVEALDDAIGSKANAAEVDSHFATKATTSALGHVMLSDSAEVTEKEGLALPTTEKNPDIEGTLANQIADLNTDLQWKHWQDSAGTLVGGIHPTLPLPNSYQELLIVITPYSEGGDKSKNLTLNVPYLDLLEVYKTYMTGEYYPPYADNIYSAGIKISKTAIYLDWTSMGSKDTTEYHYMSVYYR